MSTCTTCIPKSKARPPSARCSVPHWTGNLPAFSASPDQMAPIVEPARTSFHLFRWAFAARFLLRDKRERAAYLSGLRAAREETVSRNDMSCRWQPHLPPATSM